MADLEIELRKLKEAYRVAEKLGMKSARQYIFSLMLQAREALDDL